MFSLFKKNKEEINTANPGYEEHEKKTPFVGVILLVAMFFVSLWLGWQALDDLASIPSEPESLSVCADEFINIKEFTRRQEDYRHRDIYGPLPVEFDENGVPARTKQAEESKKIECKYSSYEHEYEVPQLLDTKISLEEFIKELQKDKEDISDELSKINSSIGELEREYGLGLLEKITQGEGIFVPDVIKKEIIKLNQEKEGLESKLSSVAGTIEIKKSELKSTKEQIKTRYENLAIDYDNRWKWHDFWVFLIQFIAVIPLFLVIFKKYLELHKKDSPYTIIFTGLVAVASVLLIRVILTWFWSLFLAELWQYIRDSALLRSLVLYLGMLLSIAIFGGSVWLLQKKVFDPRRVSLRRLRNNQCPNCQASLDLAREFCPNCGIKILNKCNYCEKDKLVALSYCPNCGKSEKK